jgi:Protein of unknown function (DUF3253)
MPSAGSGPAAELARAADSDGRAASAARIALGRGPVATRLRAATLALARHRGPTSSICPSDAARAIGGDGWRELTAQSRTIAFALARDGDVEITQRGTVIDPDRPPRGPIRIRAKSAEHT